jgi:hypothetical protein
MPGCKPTAQERAGLLRADPYLELDKDIDVEGVAALFETLGCIGLVRDCDSRSEAVKDCVCGASRCACTGERTPGNAGDHRAGCDFPDVPWLAVQERWAAAVAGTTGRRILPRPQVSDLSHLSTSRIRTTLQARLEDLTTLSAFLTDWVTEGLGAGVSRMQRA